MGKKRRTSGANTTRIVVAPAPAAPLAKRRRRASPVRRKRAAPRRRRSSSVGHFGGGLVSSETIQMAIGGALFGYAVKSGLVAKLPEIPIIGRTGTAALLLDYFGRHGGGHYCTKASRAAAAIAGYQLGSEGKITGDANEYIQGDFMAGEGDYE